MHSLYTIKHIDVTRDVSTGQNEQTGTQSGVRDQRCDIIQMKATKPTIFAPKEPDTERQSQQPPENE